MGFKEFPKLLLTDNGGADLSISASTVLNRLFSHNFFKLPFLCLLGRVQPLKYHVIPVIAVI